MAKVSFVNNIACSIPPVNENVYTDGMIELSYEEFIYWHYKVKAVTLESFSYSGSDGIGTSFSGSGTNLPYKMQVNPITSEASLVCPIQQNNVYIESSDLSYAKNSAYVSSGYSFFSEIYYESASKKYYAIPSFGFSVNLTDGTSYTGGFTSSYDYSSASADWSICNDPDPGFSCYFMGVVGTYTYTPIAGDVKTCNIYGECRSAPHLKIPTFSCNFSVQETESWSYT